MKQAFKKIIGVFSISIVLFSLASTVYASSYNTSYQFSAALTGATRYFDGNNIRFTSPNATSSFKHTLNKTYTVTLYRDKIIDDRIGSVLLYRDTLGIANWSNVGAGNYYFYLSKEIDNVTLTDNSVTIKNY